MIRAHPFSAAEAMLQVALALKTGVDASIRHRMDYFFSVEWICVFGLQPKARFNGSIVGLGTSYDVMEGVLPPLMIT